MSIFLTIDVHNAVSVGSCDWINDAKLSNETSVDDADVGHARGVDTCLVGETSVGCVDAASTRRDEDEHAPAVQSAIPTDSAIQLFAYVRRISLVCDHWARRWLTPQTGS